jgi:hypothetical protein
VWTLSNGGSVHTRRREELPRQALAAAALRDDEACEIVEIQHQSLLTRARIRSHAY